jgi:hypothetical protein
VRAIYDPARELDVAPPTLSGATYGWNLISTEGQAIASGLYLFSVENKDGGERQVGKFLIVKSDRGLLVRHRSHSRRSRSRPWYCSR